MGGVLAIVPKADGGPLGEVIRARVDGALLKRIDAICKETGRKRSDVVRRLVVAGLELHEQDRKRR